MVKITLLPREEVFPPPRPKKWEGRGYRKGNTYGFKKKERIEEGAPPEYRIRWDPSRGSYKVYLRAEGVDHVFCRRTLQAARQLRDEWLAKHPVRRKVQGTKQDKRQTGERSIPDSRFDLTKAPRLISVVEAADLTGYDGAYLVRRIHKGELPAILGLAPRRRKSKTGTYHVAPVQTWLMTAEVVRWLKLLRETGLPISSKKIRDVPRPW